MNLPCWQLRRRPPVTGVGATAVIGREASAPAENGRREPTLPYRVTIFVHDDIVRGSPMRRLLQFLVRLPRLLLIGIVRAYQLVLSPHLGNTCRFQPTCSQYAIEAFREYGALRGLILTLYRLGRCHPWGGHGYDPPRWFGEPTREDSSTARDASV